MTESSNFSFLETDDPDLAKLALLAERFLHQDPNTCLIKLRQFGELMTKTIAANIGEYPDPLEPLFKLVEKLKRKGVVSSRAGYLLTKLREIGNIANHEFTGSYEEAHVHLKDAHELAKWYYSVFKKNSNYLFLAFVEPPNLNLEKQVLENILDEYRRESDANNHEVSQKIDELLAEIERKNKEIEEIKLIKAELSQQETQLELPKPSILPKTSEEIARTISIAQKQDVSIVIPVGGGSNNEENHSILSLGTVLKERYHILKVLGHGSFGQTYIAEDVDKPNKPFCVVKQFKLTSSSSGTFNKAKILFEQEAVILEKLGGGHPCIPRLLAYFQHEERFYLVQEFIDGHPLSEEITPDNVFDESSIIELLKLVLDPLVYIHEQNIIHRDIKPSNLIRRHLDDKIVIVDFGSVKQIENNLNQSGTIVGTPGYMSSEQGLGHAILSSDIYALGMIAIQAATGKSPSSLSRSSQVDELIWEHDALQLGKPLCDIIKKMVAYQPSRRYSSAIAVLNDLNKLKKSSYIRANAGKAISKNRWLKITAATIGIGITTLIAWSIPFFQKEKMSGDIITIGILWDPKNYAQLADYLESNMVPVSYWDYLMGKKIKVIVDGDKTLSYQEARNRIALKKWDVAFTLSPVNSVFAKDQNYVYLAKMFPDSPRYQSGLIVKADSPIRSLNDITPRTMVALGGFNSASSFYLPVYDLYGKSVSVRLSNRGYQIPKMVKSREVELGSVVITDSIKNDVDIRVIHVSRDLPGGGVYLSPNLSESDQQVLRKLLLKAPPTLQKLANYGGGSESDYSEFRKIIERVERLLICADFNKNPVELFCPPNATIHKITGSINGASIKGENYVLKVIDGGNKQVYNVEMSREVFKEVFSEFKLTDVQGKLIAVESVSEPEKTSRGLNLIVNRSQQVKILVK